MKQLRIRSGSSEIACSMAGEGPPLVFLHAGVADKRMWQVQIAAFAAHHTAIAYDRRGFGETTYEPKPHSAVDDLRAVLNATTQDPPILVGCSQGGRVAIDYALTYPNAMTALVLVAPAVTGAPPPKIPAGPIAAMMQALDEAEEAGDLDRVNRLEAHAWLDGPGSPEGRVGGEPRRLFLDMNGQALRARPPGEEIGDTQAYKRLGEIKIPVLLIRGDLDFPHIKARCAHLSRVIVQASFIEVPGAAHLPSLEQAEEFNALLSGFVDRLVPPGKNLLPRPGEGGRGAAG